MLKNWMIFLWLAINTLSSLGAERTFYAYTIENGLPSNKIHKLLQAQDGLLWIATDAGVCAFDGKSFIVYDRSDGLPSNDVLGLAEDNNGWIWFKTFNKQVSYFKEGKIYTAKDDPRLNGVTTQLLNCSYYPRKEGLWIQGDSALFLFAEDTLHQYVTNYISSQAFEHNIRSFYKWSNGEPVLCNRNGVYTKSGLLYNYKVCWDVGTVDLVTNILDTIYLVHNTGIYRYYDNHQELIYKAKANEDFRYLSILPNSMGDKWLKDSRGGVSKLVEQNGTFILKPLLTEEIVTHVLNDNEGNTWVATQDNGLLFFSKYEIEKIYSTDSLAFYSSLYNESEGALYLGHENGVVLSKTSTGNDIYQTWCPYIATENRISILNFSDRLWMGSDCFSGYLVNDRIWEVYDNAEQKVGAVKDIVNLGSYTYIASSAGLHRYNSSTKNLDYLYNVRVLDLCIDKDQKLLLAAKENVYRYPELDSPIVRMSPSVTPQKIATIGEDIIVGSNDNGIYIYTPDTTFHLTSPEQLLSNYCRDIVVQNDSTFWYGSRKGVNKLIYNRARQQFKISCLTKHEGLVNNDIISLQITKDHLLITSKDAIVRLPLSFDTEVVSNALRILEVKLGQQVIDIDEPLVLEHDHEPLNIKFRHVNFVSGEAAKYFYRIIGLSDEWIEQSNNELTFLAMAPGNYELQLKAFGINGSSPQKIISLFFNVDPPFWETGYFIIMLLALTIFISFGFAQVIILRIKRREKAKTYVNSRIAMSELRALQAQMDPHFIYNSLTSIQQYILVNDKQNANRYLVKFAKLMRAMLDSSRSTSLSLYEELELLNNYIELEIQRSRHSFNYKITVSDNIDIEETYLPPMFIQPLIENAIKHGLSSLVDRVGSLLVTFSKHENELIVTVADDGVGLTDGISKSGNGHRSHASEIIQDRIKHFNTLNNYNIRLVYNKNVQINGIGTSVTLYLPLLV